ncbi:ferric reductase-like transmembrane domain-containing protein [Nocardioides sp. R-C-SC26]|uniref:ferredoxin reductase family protein n=1 Tax=Nocardioides sp. R-C-SC26 TaxID=2870414 RepID=UPI001E378262|nr:ferredoxin reductase family protein [Nocardioides sp. R-C-SC26]
MLLLVTWWWAAGDGVQDLASWPAGLVSLGRLAGLVASALLLGQVVLMARVPVIERAFGQDRLARIHRTVGFSSFTVMLAHIVLIVWGYAGGSLPDLPGMTWTISVTYPGMLLAAAGTMCLFMVVGTSIRAARRRLRYESWHLLHLYAYLGVGLAFPHQLWTGQEFTASPGRTFFWWTAWAMTLATVIVFRLGVPLAQNLRHRIAVTHVVPEGPGIVSIHMTGRRLDRLPALAGQFLTWRFLGRPGWTRGNPYSLSAAPDGRSLRITVQGVGDGSTSLAALESGTRVLFEGPHGRLTARVRTRPRVLLIGAGAGLAPIRALAEGLAYAPGDATLIERYTSVPLFREELDDLARDRGLHVLRSRGSRRGRASWLGAELAPHHRHRADHHVLAEWVPDLADRDVYVCGPPAWADLVGGDLRRLGLPDGQLHVETFEW